MNRKFSSLTKNFSKERRKWIEVKKDQLRQQMNLAEIRQALALTQSALAESLGVGQAEISKIENRTDIFVSTLRKFIEAMGGQLEIRAVFPDYDVKIEDFRSIDQRKISV